MQIPQPPAAAGASVVVSLNLQENGVLSVEAELRVPFKFKVDTGGMSAKEVQQAGDVLTGITIN
jgi:hypothetical protein